jgi:hypothetical protein
LCEGRERVRERKEWFKIERVSIFFFKKLKNKLGLRRLGLEKKSSLSEGRSRRSIRVRGVGAGSIILAAALIVLGRDEVGEVAVVLIILIILALNLTLAVIFTAVALIVIEFVSAAVIHLRLLALLEAHGLSLDLLKNARARVDSGLAARARTGDDISRVDFSFESRLALSARLG